MRLLLLITCVCLPLSLLAQGGLPSQPYIYVEGKAEIEKPADLVTLRFDVVARNSDQAKANGEVQGKAAKILGMLNDRKIPQDDVIATDLRSEPQYADEEKRGKIVGYAVTRSFSVKVRELAVFPKLVDDLLAIPGVDFSGIQSGLAKEREVEDQVGDQALTKARERAERMLKPLGMKLDAVYAVSPVAFLEIQRKLFGGAGYEGVLSRRPG
ncbi:MAG TPA: SIMPL domain-containing protein [Chthoniobacterales bacterium]|nr:SIMPL domain-containing protein [Chthoniobacterales bacterium]